MQMTGSKILITLLFISCLALSGCEWDTDNDDYTTEVSFTDAGQVGVMTLDMSRNLDCDSDETTEDPEPYTDVLAGITVTIADRTPGLTVNGYTIEYLPESSIDSTGTMVMPPALSSLSDVGSFSLYIPSDSSTTFTITCFSTDQKDEYAALVPADLDPSRYTIRITLHCTDDNGEDVNLDAIRAVYFGNYDNC